MNNGLLVMLSTWALSSFSGRTKLGAWQNRLRHTISRVGTSAENLQAAESRIRDVDGPRDGGFHQVPDPAAGSYASLGQYGTTVGAAVAWLIASVLQAALGCPGVALFITMRKTEEDHNG